MKVGSSLFPYMLKMVEDVHKAFPDMTIIAWRHFFRGRRLEGIRKGCDSTLDLYTALTFQGFGVVKDIHEARNKKAWERNPAEFQ